MYEVLCTQVCAATTSQQHQRLSHVRNTGHNARKLYYKVASSQLPAPQIAPRTKVVLQSRRFSASSSRIAPRTTVVLPSRQFSSSHSPATPRTKVVLPSRQFSSSSSQLVRVLKLHYKVASSQLPAPQIAPRTKVVLETRQFSASSSTDCSAY